MSVKSLLSQRAQLDRDAFVSAHHQLLALRVQKLEDGMSDDQFSALLDAEESQLRKVFSLPAGVPYQVFDKIGLLREVLVTSANDGQRADHGEISFLASIEADLCRFTIGWGDES